MKAINSLDAYSDFARKVIEEEQGKKHTKGSYDVCTPRACIAREMLGIYASIERKRRLRAKWEEEMEANGMSIDVADHRGSDNPGDGERGVGPDGDGDWVCSSQTGGLDESD